MRTTEYHLGKLHFFGNTILFFIRNISAGAFCSVAQSADYNKRNQIIAEHPTIYCDVTLKYRTELLVPATGLHSEIGSFFGTAGE